jgi:hypothetical protein
MVLPALIPSGRLIHFLHFLAAAIRDRGRGRGIFKRIALVTNIAFLFGLRGLGFFGFVLTTTTATGHNRSPQVDFFEGLAITPGGFLPVSRS